MRSNSAKRSSAKALYGPNHEKTLHNLLKRELVLNFGFENKLKIADVLIESMLEIIDRYGQDKEKVLPHQIVWPAVAKDDFPGYGKTMDKTKHIPVVLTLWTSDELKALVEGQNPKTLLPQRIARVHKETFRQKGVLSSIDTGLIFNISASRASQLRQQWETQHDEVLPTRGSYHDLGLTFTHKQKIIELHLQGFMPSEISRKMDHDVQCIDRYIRDFERTLPFFEEGQTISKIAFYTRLSERLVKEYYKIYKQTYMYKINP